MGGTPNIVIVSCSNTKPRSLIKLITKDSEIAVDPENPAVIKHPWVIDTKYYTACVNMVGLEENYERSEEFNKNVEALIILMDSNKITGLEDLGKWDCIENDCDLEVKLLVSNYCTNETKVNRAAALEWCLQRGFEFIELYPSMNKSAQVEEDDEDDFKEKVGVERIIEALQAHVWPNLVRKNKRSINKETTKVQEISMEVAKPKKEGAEAFSSDVTDNFAELFSQLHMMKDSIQDMPMNQRKQCAEQMVTAFWKAIGGEEEEIFDL